MWKIFGIMVVTIGIILYEVPPLLKKKLIKELYVFSVLLVIGVVLSVTVSMHINIPNPLDMITFIYEPFSDFISDILR